MLTEEDIEQMKKPSLWGAHNRALREHPEYQMLGLMDCLREEMMLNMPILPKQVPLQIVREEPFNKRQWDTVQQLKAQVLFLSSKVNEMRAKASKRKTQHYNPF